MKTLKTTPSTVLLTLLRDYRLSQRPLTQSDIAKRLKLTASGYTKLELGHSKMRVDTFILVCGVMGSAVSDVMRNVERICADLKFKGWLIVPDLDDELDDLLLIHRDKNGDVLPYEKRNYLTQTVVSPTDR